MKILAIADRAPTQPLLPLVEHNQIDLICTLGDLDYFGIADLQNVNHIPKLGIYGNHCSGQYFKSLGIQNMHLKTWEFQGLTFGGFEGSVRYKASPLAKMYTQEEAAQLLANFPHVDVMLTHCPPYRVNDEPNDLVHQGFVGLRDYVECQKPRYLLHGHTYPEADQLVTQLGSTSIIYVFQEKIIELS